MEFLPLVIVFAIVFVLMLAALILVLLLSIRLIRESTTLQVTQTQTFLTSLLGSSRQQSSEVLERTIRSHSSSVEALTALLTHQSTLLSSKDPLAYQMVTAARAAATEPQESDPGYAAPDDAYLERLQQAQQLIESAGVNPDVDFFTTQGAAQ